MNDRESSLFELLNKHKVNYENVVIRDAMCHSKVSHMVFFIYLNNKSSTQTFYGAVEKLAVAWGRDFVYGTTDVKGMVYVSVPVEALND